MLPKFLVYWFLTTISLRLNHGQPIKSIVTSQNSQRKTPEMSSSHQTNCEPDQYRCKNGACLSSYSRCNQIIECSDGDDEENCQELRVFQCPYKCRNSSVCIAEKLLCDERPHCPFGDDEEEKICWSKKISIWTLSPKANPQQNYSHQKDQSLLFRQQYSSHNYKRPQKNFLNGSKEGEHSGPQVIDVFKSVPISGSNTYSLIYPSNPANFYLSLQSNGTIGGINPDRLGNFVNLLSFQNLFQVFGSNNINATGIGANLIGNVVGSGNDVGNGNNNGNNNGNGNHN